MLNASCNICLYYKLYGGNYLTELLDIPSTIYNRRSTHNAKLCFITPTLSKAGNFIGPHSYDQIWKDFCLITVSLFDVKFQQKFWNHSQIKSCHFYVVYPLTNKKLLIGIQLNYKLWITDDFKKESITDFLCSLLRRIYWVFPRSYIYS